MATARTVEPDRQCLQRGIGERKELLAALDPP
jgi:hypothetical protein